MIKSIRIDGVKLEENTLQIINTAMLEYKEKGIARDKDVQTAFKEIKKEEKVFNKASVGD